MTQEQQLYYIPKYKAYIHATPVDFDRVIVEDDIPHSGIKKGDIVFIDEGFNND